MDFIYLDGDEERQLLTDQIDAVRQQVIQLALQVPEQHHYVAARYGEHSLATLLVHLWLFDSASLFLVRAAANNKPLRINPLWVRAAHRAALHFYRRRLVGSSIKSIQRQQQQIVGFVRSVSIDVLHRDVYDPYQKAPYTVERALQAYYVHYWQRQLQRMQQVEDVV